MGSLLLAGGGVLVVATAVLLACCLRFGSGIDFLLALYLVAAAEVIAVALVLSPARLLVRSWLVAALFGVFVVAIVFWVRRERPLPPVSGVLPAARVALRNRAVFVLAVLAIAVHSYALVVGLAVPQSSPDTMLYHLPRAALWKQQHAVRYVDDAPDERIDASLPGSDIQITVTMILSGGDRYTTLVQLAALLASCLAIVGIALRLGLSIEEAAFGAFAYSTFPVVVLQTPTALNDLALAAPLMVCAYYAMGRTRTDLVLVGLAIALAVVTKLTAILALPVLVLFALAAAPRSRWLRLVIAGFAGIAAGSIWYVVNLVETGHVDGGFSAAFPQIADRSVWPTIERTGRLARDFLEMSGAEGEEWLRSPAPGVALALVVVIVAGVLFLTRRRSAAGVAALVAVTAGVVYPMLATWFDVAGRAARQVFTTAGLTGSLPSSRVPVELYESPIRSAYGVAFLVLFICAGALVIRDVARHRLPGAAAAAVAAPLVFTLILALSIEYDPLRIRFAAFPVALATAALGVAVRVRPLAWTAVGLTAGTLAILVAYFIPRPAGLALLPSNRSDESFSRWFVQAGGGGGDKSAFRFLETEIASDATVALDLSRNTYSYPAWDAGLERTVVFVPRGGVVPSDAEWLIVGPGRRVDEGRLARDGWQLELESPRRWRIYGR